LLPVDDEDFANMLHRQRRQTRADSAEQDLALLAWLARHPDFDQLVALQADVDLVQHRVGQALVADHHHRVQGVCAGFEGLALKRSQVASHRILVWRRFY
jgi:hypothetical protein